MKPAQRRADVIRRIMKILRPNWFTVRRATLYSSITSKHLSDSAKTNTRSMYMRIHVLGILPLLGSASAKKLTIFYVPISNVGGSFAGAWVHLWAT